MIQSYFLDQQSQYPLDTTNLRIQADYQEEHGDQTSANTLRSLADLDLTIHSLAILVVSNCELYSWSGEFKRFANKNAVDNSGNGSLEKIYDMDHPIIAHWQTNQTIT